MGRPRRGTRALSGPTTPEGQLLEQDAPTTATHSAPVSPEDQLSLPIAAQAATSGSAPDMAPDSSREEIPTPLD